MDDDRPSKAMRIYFLLEDEEDDNDDDGNNDDDEHNDQSISEIAQSHNNLTHQPNLRVSANRPTSMGLEREVIHCQQSVVDYNKLSRSLGTRDLSILSLAANLKIFIDLILIQIWLTG